jgi:ATP-dependent DNA helicase DinG
LKTLEPTFDILKHFPSCSEPRKQQIEALEKIQNSFSKKKKFVIGCLPTGSGKSHIGLAVANSSNQMPIRLKSLINDYSIYKKNKNNEYSYEKDFLDAESNSAFILTITKSLQDQYNDLFNDLKTIKGKNNYQCDVDYNFSAETAPCIFSPEIKQSCFSSDRCPYYKARNSALSSQSPILNYRVFFNLPDFLRKREIYICDEANGLEDELVSKFTLEVNYDSLKREGIPFKKLLSDDDKSCLFWIQDLYIQIEKMYNDLKGTLSDSSDLKGTNNKKYVKEMQKLSRVNRMYMAFGEILDYWQSCSFLLEKRDSDSVVFCPYDIKPIAKNMFDKADKILMMSATISNHKEYAKSLGITDYEYFELDSSFDPKKSPIMCSKKYKLSYKTMEQNLPFVIDMAKIICDKHKNEKGVIHTHTNLITEKIRSKVKTETRFLFKDGLVNNESLLEEHKNTKDPTVLVSPSLDTGISLDDELGRFQIIMKAPYLPLGSKRIKKMFEKNPKHYSMKMLDKLIQMCGRCTRSKDDYSITYILDATIVDAIFRDKENLPKHFLKRFV